MHWRAQPIGSSRRCQSSPEAALAGATTYLRLFGTAAGGTMLAADALAAARIANGGGDGAEGGAGDASRRIALARFFAENLAAQAPALARVVTEGADSLLAADTATMTAGAS